MGVTVEAAIAAIPSWRGRVSEVTLLSGGLTNHNYLVRVDDTPYVVRIPGAQTELLAIDRENELYNTRAAASVGIGPEVIHVLPELGVTVLGFIAGRTMSNETIDWSRAPMFARRRSVQPDLRPALARYGDAGSPGRGRRRRSNRSA